MSERDRSIEEGIAAFRKTEEANLRKCGWVKRHVFPTTKQPGIDFSYTIGLTEKFGAPELIMTGLGEAADHIINHAVRLMEDEGLRYHDWFLSDRFARGYNLCFREVTRETAMKFAYGAFDRYGPGVRILQIVAPDQKGVFHWEAGCDNAWILRQSVMQFVQDEQPPALH